VATAEPAVTVGAPTATVPGTPVLDPAASTFDTCPIVGIDEALQLDAAGHDAGQARAHQARAHEAAAEVLADRGDWRRAYQHLRAAMALVHLGDTPPVHVPEQLRREVDRLRRERAEAREQSRRDSLTATWNRRYLDERLSTLRDGTTEAACVALVDVDHFKLVNDTFGHLFGDRVLTWTAELIRSTLRASDIPARYGGDEFAIILPETDAEEAMIAAERILAAFRDRAYVGEQRGPVPIGASIGVATFPADGRTATELIAAADLALYRVKREGGHDAAGAGDAAA
jgi:diguanylate cyclase (GGDEF)-like protein